MTLVSVIIINFNGMSDLPACLGSITAQDHPDLELVLVDNCSTDGSADMLRDFSRQQANLRRFAADSPLLISNDTNEGFSAALNRGIRESGGELVMSLNTDVVLEPSFISSLVGTIEADDRAGSASGKLLRFPPGGHDNVIDSAGHVVFRNRLAENIAEGQRGTESALEPAEVFGTCGAAALYRREMLQDVQVMGEYFDEQFFAFWEDLDMDWRSRIRGWKCLYNPQAIAYHRRGGAGYRKSLLVEYHNYKNRYLLMIKNDSPLFLLKNLPGILVTEMLKAGALLFRCPRALLALIEVARLTPLMLSKRRVIQSARVLSARDLEAWLQPFPYRKWIRRHLFNRGRLIVDGEMERR
jgi:GT2 family glycosyltransferase